MMIGFWTILLFAIALVFVYVYGEVACYWRGGDVWEWTKKLARWIDRPIK